MTPTELILLEQLRQTQQALAGTIIMLADHLDVIDMSDEVRRGLLESLHAFCERTVDDTERQARARLN